MGGSAKVCIETFRPNGFEHADSSVIHINTEGIRRAECSLCKVEKIALHKRKTICRTTYKSIVMDL